MELKLLLFHFGPFLIKLESMRFGSMNLRVTVKQVDSFSMSLKDSKYVCIMYILTLPHAIYLIYQNNYLLHKETQIHIFFLEYPFLHLYSQVIIH